MFTTSDIIHSLARLANFISSRAAVCQSLRLGRQRFRYDFVFNGIWRGRRYATKQVEAVVVEEDGDLLVITVIARYY
jgi:hypothetical protein